jgi:Xaa-Pro aminopeptidase
LRRAILEHGADDYGYTLVSEVSDATVVGPTNQPLGERALVYLDGGAVVRGYCCDFNRIVSLGEPTAEKEDVYGALAEVLKVGVGAARTSAKASDVRQAMALQLAEYGLGDAADVGRLGHGTGLQQPEPPSIHFDDLTVLEPGVVISVEPNCFVPGIGLMILEDMVEVTDEGGRILSPRPTPPELPRV